MPLFKMTEADLRDLCKRNVETLEFWLRRVIHEQLRRSFGDNYWEVSPPIIKKDIRDRVSDRINKSPAGRFPRWIDATLIEHQIDLLCNERLYKENFKSFFVGLFPENFSCGREYLKFVLDKCAIVRNALYHSNPISIRQAEQLLCYVNDIIDSVKTYYSEKNMQTDFNAPSIISYSDSLGRKFYSDQMGNGSTKHLDFQSQKLFCDSRIKMSIEIDSSFKEDQYKIIWSRGTLNEIGVGSEIVIELDQSYVSEFTTIRVRVVSNKTWHRHGLHDDDLRIFLSVLPPLE